MVRLLNIVDSLPPSVALAVSGLFVLLLGAADYFVVPPITFSIFFLVPVSLAAVRAGRRAGYLIAIASVLVWTLAAPGPSGSHVRTLVTYWDGLVLGGFLLLHTALLTALTRSIEHEKALARLDPLTRVPNFRHFQEHADQETRRALRSQKPLTVAIMDLDNFKKVNDTFGHSMGDELLRAVAGAAWSGLRGTDLVARVGGDEFAFLLPEAKYEDASRVLRRIYDRLCREVNIQGCPVTVSIGAVTFNVVPPNVDGMMKRADDLLYSVKQDGKNHLKHTEWPTPLSTN